MLLAALAAIVDPIPGYGLREQECENLECLQRRESGGGITA